MYTETATQRLSPQGQVNPQSLSPGSSGTGGVDLQKFRRALFLLNVGAFGASATVDMKLQVSPDNSTWTDLATANANLSSCAIAQMLAAGGNNKIATLEVRADQLASITSQAARYVQALVTVGTAATQVQCLALGVDAIQHPGSQYNEAAVTQSVVVGGPS